MESEVTNSFLYKHFCMIVLYGGATKSVEILLENSWKKCLVVTKEKTPSLWSFVSVVLCCENSEDERMEDKGEKKTTVFYTMHQQFQTVCRFTRILWRTQSMET